MRPVIFSERERFGKKQDEQDKGACTALEQVSKERRNIIVGTPGGGKSTFFEWLQLQVASAEVVFAMDDGQQAIPLLLRVRQLDSKNLPYGADLIAKATASQDIATVMPLDWIDRQLKNGRVLFMLDGLDEIEPTQRDQLVLPWLKKLCDRYPRCAFAISSRPVGYPAGTLKALDFLESDLLDFGKEEIEEYIRHWCTAVRLAQNELEEEARRQGAEDAAQIVCGFQDHPYIRDLARNPLMLSAICLVNYFEKGQLPEDRARLYQLCVEGLLHNWDQRRGIRSEFGFEEKLRACREVAIAMQADDRAEYVADKVQSIFSAVLGTPDLGERLLEHIRYRTGLLLERRPNIYAFAHLTFQEYLAARAIHEGNRLGIDVQQLIREHDDGRWREVIALYCGLAPVPVARQIIESLIGCEDTLSLSSILVESYFTAGKELRQDCELRDKLIKRVACAPHAGLKSVLDKFPEQIVAPIANECLGTIKSNLTISETHFWFGDHKKHLDIENLSRRIISWSNGGAVALTELERV